MENGFQRIKKWRGSEWRSWRKNFSTWYQHGTENFCKYFHLCHYVEVLMHHLAQWYLIVPDQFLWRHSSNSVILGKYIFSYVRSNNPKIVKYLLTLIPIFIESCTQNVEYMAGTSCLFNSASIIDLRTILKETLQCTAWSAWIKKNLSGRTCYEVYIVCVNKCFPTADNEQHDSASFTRRLGNIEPEKYFVLKIRWTCKFGSWQERDQIMGPQL